MRIAMIGSGYVGLVTGACLADKGNHVWGVDIDPDKVATLSAGKCPFFEPGLEELLEANLAAKRLAFTSDVAKAVADAQVVFIAVGTPTGANGAADLSYVEAAGRAIGRALRPETVVVMKSTVPVGTCDRLEQIIAGETKHPFYVVMNPEFLKEGNAVEDFIKPDRVVVGANEDYPRQVVTELYQPFVRNNRPILQMSRRAAELSKYAANAFLATRISFVNEIAHLCECFDIDVDEVRKGMGSDARIGHHFLYPGIGYGGSCFPKDVQALIHTAQQAGIESEILAAVHRRNYRQRDLLIDKVIKRLGPSLAGKQIAVWGLAFKPRTDDIREAPALTVIEKLRGAGATIAAHDPKAMPNARAVLGDGVQFVDDAYDALPGAAALMICTEWNEYLSPDFERIRAALVEPLIFDGRNLYGLGMMQRQNFEYYSLGRPTVRPR